ncbi:MAG: sirohydrochlorin chelatase [Alphaproteobacteria bacterium]|nr:sirohydrochlorin chelatase [Alphaproteobacteria bacterium]
MKKTGVLICGHGSRDADAIREFQAAARGIETRLPQYAVESAFLEFATPIIREGLDALRARGVEHILAVPGMLFAAGHVKNDVPSVLNTYRAQHGVDITFGRDLGVDMKLIRAAGDRIRTALSVASTDIPLAETALVVVGRGTSDPDANSNISKVARLLWEGFGFGWAETAYSGVTFPLTKPALEHVVRMGYKRVLVFPYFLFTGVLVKRIYRASDMVADENPDIEFIKVPYLNDHPLVLDAFAERVQEMLVGANNMNCLMCKYREQVLGFEGEVGSAQASHHHHVEGVGTNAGRTPKAEQGANRNGDAHRHDHDHHHHHDHRDHGHGRTPYPHAAHPLGPVTLDPEEVGD